MSAAEEVWKGMQQDGPPPDLHSYNTLIYGYAEVAAPTQSPLIALQLPFL
jgi:hypothetical protein